MRGVLLFLLIVRFESGASAQSKVSTSQRGPFYEFQFAGLRLSVDAFDGGKIASFQLDGREVLTPRSVDSLTYGSTFWVAPQTWGWPPPLQMDGFLMETRWEGDHLWLTGPVIPKIGVFLTKEIWLNPVDSSVYLACTYRNSSPNPVPVAGWEISRSPKGGLAFLPGGEIQKKNGLTELSLQKIDGMYWLDIPDRRYTRSGKVWIDGHGGWMAYAHTGLLLVKRFKDLPPAEAYPGESDTEIYVDDDKPYLELEETGRWQTLEPGDSLRFEVSWRVAPIPPTVLVQPGSAELLRMAEKLRH
ncbi:MAG: DUF4380 domain-containing protein [Sphingobacteriaceae bacterium]|nr:DUF4380 domain-containing protein [Cytophagaceae bacterium]